MTSLLAGLLFVATLGLAGFALFSRERSRAAAALALFATTVAALSALSRSPSPPPPQGTPEVHRSGGYIGSGSCRECHPSEYASHARTYHRTMTRKAAELAWDGQSSPQLPARIEAEGRIFDLTRPAPGAAPTVTGPSMHDVARRILADSSEERDSRSNPFQHAPVVTRSVPLVTGSHHYLAFWVEDGDGVELRQLPFVYLLTEKAFAPRREVFLMPSHTPPHVARFNGACIQCHTVAGMPAEQDGRFDTKVADFGIGCEACHGPGRKHAEKYRSPLARLHARTQDTPSEYQSPARLPAADSSVLCGQCHSYFVPSDPDKWWESGFLSASQDTGPPPPELPGRTLLTWEQPEVAQSLGVSRDLGTIFWDDGTVLVGGREYNGLIRSACYELGEGDRKLGCLSCHSMHNADPVDQLKVNYERACVDCHAGLARSPESHSHHPQEIGCVDCHMPKTTYALMKAIRSHRITSPRPQATKPPNACVLCHTSESKEWLEKGWDRLSAPEATPPDPLPAPAESRPLGGYLSIAGSAVTRAIMARALVEPFALAQTGKAYARTLLDALADDPYPVVRRITASALVELEASSAPELRVAPPSAAELSAWRAERDNTDQVVSE